MGQGVPAEGADLVVKQKLWLIQSVIKGTLSGQLPDLIKKPICFGDGIVFLHIAIIFNTHALLYKKIVEKVG